jgi:hypothetical protein
MILAQPGIAYRVTIARDDDWEHVREYPIEGWDDEGDPFSVRARSDTEATAAGCTARRAAHRGDSCQQRTSATG